MTIRYNDEVDRFFDDETGRFVTNISGMLSSVGRRERKKAERSGTRDKFREELKRKLSRRRKKVKIRRKTEPPRTPAQHFDFEFDSSEGELDLYLDEFILRNIEFMEQEVIY